MKRKPTNKRVVLLLSGGLDSTVMLYYLLSLGYQVHCLLFNYGQKHVAELRFAKQTCNQLGVPFTEIELCRIKNLFLRCALTDGVCDNVIVPNRNGVFLNIAAAIASSIGFDSVAFGATQDDYARFPDCRPAFVGRLNATLRQAAINVSIEAPYISKTKAEIVQIGKRLNVPFDQTMSCYNGNNCGKCLACKTRKKALKCAK